MEEFEKKKRRKASRRTRKASKSSNPNKSREQVEAWLAAAATIEQAVASRISASGAADRITAYAPYSSKAWIGHFAKNAPTEAQVHILSKNGDFYSDPQLDREQFIESSLFLP